MSRCSWSQESTEELASELDALMEQHLEERDKINLCYYLNEFETNSCDLSELLANLMQNLLVKLPSPMTKYKLLRLIKQLYVDQQPDNQPLDGPLPPANGCNKRQLDLRLFEAMTRRYLLASNAMLADREARAGLASALEARKWRRQRRAAELRQQQTLRNLGPSEPAHLVASERLQSSESESSKMQRRQEPGYLSSDSSLHLQPAELATTDEELDASLVGSAACDRLGSLPELPGWPASPQPGTPTELQWRAPAARWLIGHSERPANNGSPSRTPPISQNNGRQPQLWPAEAQCADCARWQQRAPASSLPASPVAARRRRPPQLWPAGPPPPPPSLQRAGPQPTERRPRRHRRQPEQAERRQPDCVSLVAAPSALPSSVAEQVAAQMKEQASSFVQHFAPHNAPNQRHRQALKVRRTLRVEVRKTRPILGIAIEGGYNVSGQLLPRIVCVHEDGAAYQCGQLRASDLILQVNGISTVNMSHHQIANTIANAYYQDPRPYIEFLIGESSLI